jgi:hypothetical protein
MCVECLSKETGHDDCTIENCTTCKEFVAKVTKVQFYRDKVLNIQREEMLSQGSNMILCTDMIPNHSNALAMGCNIQQRGLSSETPKLLGAEIESDNIPFSRNTTTNGYSFEEKRYYYSAPLYKQQVNPTYSLSSSSYRQATEQGYETDSSFGQSSVSSGGGEYNYSASNIIRKRKICKLCKVTFAVEYGDTHRREMPISICDICTRGHRNCEKKDCKTCANIAKECSRKAPYIQYSYKHRQNEHSRIIVSMNDEEEYEEEPFALTRNQKICNKKKDYNLTNTSLIEKLQNQEIGSPKNMSPKKTYLSKGELNSCNLSCSSSGPSEGQFIAPERLISEQQLSPANNAKMINENTPYSL